MESGLYRAVSKRACTPVPAPWSQQHERARLVLLQLAATALPERSPGPGRRHPRQPRCAPCPRHVSIWEVFVSKVSAPGCTEAVASCVSL